MSLSLLLHDVQHIIVFYTYIFFMCMLPDDDPAGIETCRGL
jgi:hypothetical protein